MGTLPSPYAYPNRTSIPNANNTSNPNPGPNTAPGLKTPSFEEVSKLFSLPLSDAADSLGVCPSVLKKVCYENGLVRWPYRKFQAGKSIEEIKKDDAIEKEKLLIQLKISGQGNSLASSAVSTSVSLQTSRMPSQQPTRDDNGLNSTINKGNTSIFDEFKYGFPSDGLSRISFKWWGNKSDVENDVDSKKNSTEDAEERKQQHGDPLDTTANLSSIEVNEDKKDETDAALSSAEVTEGGKGETDADLSTMEASEGKKDKTDADLSSMEAIKGEKDETDADLSTMEGKKDETDAILSSMEVTEGGKDEANADLSTMEAKERKKDEVDANLSSMEVTEGEKEEADADLSSMEVTEGKKDETNADLSTTEVTEGEKDEAGADLSTMVASEGTKDEKDGNPQWGISLSALRKRAAEDGQRALKLGVYRGYNVKTLDRSKKQVLLQIFRSSLPCEWGEHMSSGS
ncbi:hypothetical protein ACS0TY_018794 [Phlomoides rotata]